MINSTCGPEFFDVLCSLKIKSPVVYNPFFVRQGRIQEDIKAAEFVLIGDDGCHCVPLLNLYQRLGLARYVIMDRRSAAVTKLAINSFLTIKIAFANLIGDLCVCAGLDPHVVLSAVGMDSRINPQYLRDGDGYGGPCLPIDAKHLSSILWRSHFPACSPTRPTSATNATYNFNWTGSPHPTSDMRTSQCVASLSNQEPR